MHGTIVKPGGNKSRASWLTLSFRGLFPDNKNYEKYADESAAFYNSFFLDNSDGGVYFNVLANGCPIFLD